MAFGSPGFTAGGNIDVSRFVIPDTTDNFSVIQATAATTLPVGISSEASRRAPNAGISNSTYAAQAGEQLVVYQPTDVCYLSSGAAFTAGDTLKSDANGRGVTATSGTYYGARALESATASGQNIRVYVELGRQP